MKQGRDFSRARAQGRRMQCGGFVLNWLHTEPGQASRLGVITTRKLGNAVVRNRARRLLREVYRLHQHELRGPLDLVLVARSEMVKSNFQKLEREFLACLRRARLLIDHEPGATTLPS